MKEEQSKAQIVEAILKYHQSGIPFTTPGLKMGAGILEEDKAAIVAETFYNDIPMQNGADDRREQKGIQKEAENLAARALGADQSYFSINGSLLSAHVAMLAVADTGDKVLVARNAHKSMITVIILVDVDAIFMELSKAIPPPYLSRISSLSAPYLTRI